MDILIVEDNPDHALLATEALRSLAEASRVSLVTTGEDALDFIYRRSPHELAPRPDLILLDLRLPEMSGFDVLETLKGDPDFRSIPVVLLTASVREADVTRAYELGTNMYIAKPARFEEFARTLAKIPAFWLGIAALPGARK